jgi:hypothetical protein
MTNGGRVHDRAILDALDASEGNSFSGRVWRVARSGRPPMRGSSAAGRWSPGGDVEVLYTSIERDGALAEIGFRLSLEPVWPSRIAHEIHELDVEAGNALRFASTEALAPFGIDPARYSSFEYEACQALAAAAHFLEFDGLIVPGARHDAANLVLFMDRPAAANLHCVASQSVDWNHWRAARGR